MFVSRFCWLFGGGYIFSSPSLGLVFCLLICWVFFFSCVFLDADVPVESDTDEDGPPRISLAEMLEDLHISEDATGGEGANMMTE